jgi:type III restriction enzyme
LEFVALATPELKRDLDAAGKKQAKTWFVLYGEKIRVLPENRRQAYDEIQGLASEPELNSLTFPDVVEAKIEGDLWPRHLYTDENGDYPANFNDWERPVLKEELKRSDLVGWLRVVPRKRWALTVPYISGGPTGRAKPVYIDFLVVRQRGDGLIVDIIDPHNPNLGDAADKLAGLAQYAEMHGNGYGRIESIIMAGDSIRRLNLQDTAVRDRATKVRTSADVMRVFEDLAVSVPTG